tara:strand:+ start:334 stop:1374 length:1041 start_codon:yes stop_codon:yes gene_type:complete
MSELKTNKIQTNDTNNVAIDNALGLKSYTTTQRDALTSAAGDVIYNSETGTIDFYNGESWNATSDTTFITTISYLVIAGGGGGGQSTGDGGGGGGGGAGGYRTSYGTGNISGANSPVESTITLTDGTSANVTVGAGGPVGGGTTHYGNDSVFHSITSLKGGAGMRSNGTGSTGGSGGGAGGDGGGTGYAGTANQGKSGGNGGGSNGSGSGGGGGAGGNGLNTTGSNGGNGGVGLASAITGTSIFRGGGGGGGSSDQSTDNGSGGNGGGGTSDGSGTAGAVNTGGGGGGGDRGGTNGTAGGSGVVILRYANTSTITLSAGLTGSTTTDGSDKVTTITAGTGTVSWSR